MQQLDRSQGIGCSDIPAIMDCTPYSDPYKKWEEKVYGKKDEDNPAMKFGRETEPLIRELTEKKLETSLPPIRLLHPSKPWLWASLDGYNEEKGVIAEFKTSNEKDHLSAIEGKVPEKYWPQVQGQMEVVGVDHLFYCSYHLGDLEVIKVQKDEAYCKLMMQKVEAFWECVVLEVPPEGYVCMKGNQTWNHLAEELHAIRGQIKGLVRHSDGLMEDLKRLSDKKSARGIDMFLIREECNGGIDYDKAIEDYISNMRAHYPEVSFPAIDFELYRKKTFEKWRLKAIKKNGD